MNKEQKLDDLLIELKEAIEEEKIIILSSEDDIAKVIDDDCNIITTRGVHLMDDLYLPGKLKCKTLTGHNYSFKCEELECDYFELDKLEAKKILCDSAFFHTVKTDNFTARKWIVGKELECKRLNAPMATIMNLNCDDSGINCQKVISASTISKF